MRRLLATVSLAALAIGAALPEALAYLKAGPPMAGPGHHRLKVPSGAPPLDGFTVTAAYSFRKLRTAYSGNALRLRRASDNAELDIGFLGFVPGLGAPWDEAAAAAHCASTNCFVRTRNDQSGNGRDEVQLTAANQPALIFNCRGQLPCLRTTTLTQSMIAVVAFAPATGVATLNAVAQRSSGTGQCNFIRENGNNNALKTNSVANSWALTPGTGITAAAADNTWHTAIGVLNTTGSLLNIDGVETAASLAGVTASGGLGLVGANTTTCDQIEEIALDNYVMSPAERVVLTNNQRGYIGP